MILLGVLWLKSRANQRGFGSGSSVFELSLSLRSVLNNNPVAFPARQEIHPAVAVVPALTSRVGTEGVFQSSHLLSALHELCQCASDSKINPIKNIVTIQK